VTTAQLQVMKAIQHEPGISGAQLARSYSVTPQSAQALLKGLEEDGWIVRSKDRGNDRILHAELTPEGKKLLRTAEKEARVIETRLWRGVPESSIAALNAVLEQCLANLELENLDPEADRR
jgi:DNA-binding MarR family transcriptional regulator